MKLLAFLLSIAMPMLLSAQATPAGDTPAVRLPKGTPLYVALAHGVSAKTAQPGDRVVLRTTGAVVMNGVALIPADAIVFGSVARIVSPRGGRAATIAIDAESVQLEDGRRLLLDGELVRGGQDYSRSTRGGGSGASVGASITVPLGRRNITPNLEAGTLFIAHTAKDY